MTAEVLTVGRISQKRSENAGIVIRLMRESDINDVLLIEEASYSTPWTRAMFLIELRDNLHSALWVVVDDEKKRPIGYVCFWVLFDELQLMNLAVHTDYRRKRIGQELLHRVLRQGGEKGVRKVSLEVRDSNIQARGLYEKMGFKVMAVRPRYYRDPDENGLIMVLDG